MLLIVITTLLAVSAKWALAQNTSTAGAFLEDVLPLRILATTPTALLSNPANAAVNITQEQAITVVFTRPVIALGSDFGTNEAFAGKAPFEITCADAPVPPGRARWVTTTIARYDVIDQWPTDLNCTLTFNTELTAYDGAKLRFNGTAQRSLRTPPQTMRVNGVVSERASNLTNGLWDGTLGLPDDALPEVPPDGIVTLSFSSPVNLTLVSQALRLEPAQDTVLNVSRCETRTQPRGPTANLGSLLQYCAAVSFSAPLKTETKYQLVLPAGARYNAAAGPLRQALTVNIGGLRAFRIPIRQDFQAPKSSADYTWDTTQFRRLTVWLPHGLDPSVTVDQLINRMSVCQLNNPYSANPTCSDTKVNITSAKLRSKGLLQLTLATLQPATRYQITVSADDTIMDGFGLPLKASSGKWWTSTLYPYINTPGASVALFSKASHPTTWPVIMRGADNQITRVSVWSLNVTDQASADLLAYALTAQDRTVDLILGNSTATVQRGNSSEATLQELPLSATSDVHVVAQCCNKISWPGNTEVSSQVQLISRSKVQASWMVSPGKDILVWVTGTEAPNTGPVVNATAYVYTTNGIYMPTFVGKCTTDASGTCTIPMPTASSSSEWLAYRGLVIAPNHAGVIYSELGSYGPEAPSTNYTGTLALDRALVRQGDTLHVTGYIGQRDAGGGGGGNGSAVSTWPVKAPDVTQATVLISPGWQGGNAVTVTVPVTASHGSLHASIPVPPDAKPGSYSVQLGVGKAPVSVSGRRRLLRAHGRTLAQMPAPGILPGVVTPGSSPAPAPGSSPAPSPRPSSPAPSPSPKPTSPAPPSSTMPPGFNAPPSLSPKPVSPMPPAVRPPSSPPSSSNSEWAILAYEQIVVSDPRPPTADLQLTTPPWVPPNGTVSVKAQATSYLGSDVSQAKITLTWRTGKAQGSLDIITDVSGAANGTINLGTLPAVNQSKAGDTLSIEAAWIGPTRERIVRTATVDLQDTARRIELTRTYTTDVPGLPWGVNVRVISNDNKAKLSGVPVIVTLAPNTTAGALCGDRSTCAFSSEDESAQSTCKLAIPCVGAFLLTACTNDTAPTTCTTLTLGLNATQWDNTPWASWDIPTLSHKIIPNSNGSLTAQLSFSNPWGAGVSALVTWGSTGQALQRQYFENIAQGSVTLSVSVGQECDGGCRAAVLVSVPERTAVDPVPGLVISKLFNPYGPHSHNLGVVTLNITQKPRLTVDVSVAGETRVEVDGVLRPVVAPGTNTTVSVNVSRAGAPVSDAEVTILAVDKAVLDLVPYPLKDLLASLGFENGARLSGSASPRYVAPGVVSLVFETLLRRLKIDPWIYADTTILTEPWQTRFKAAVDYNDTAFFDRYTSALTYLPSGAYSSDYGPLAQMAANAGVFAEESIAKALGPGAVPSPSPAARAISDSAQAENTSGSGSGSSQSGAPQARVASAFNPVPLFTVIRTTTDGKGTATLTAPQNLGTFIVRAYAVARDVNALGSGESTVVVRRMVSLTASLPRITRIGDNFLAGVLVTAPDLPSNTTKDLIVTVTLTPTDKPLRLVSASNTQNVKLSSDNNQAEIRFNFTAIMIGSTDLTFTVTDTNTQTNTTLDSLTVRVPVLAPRAPVFVGTSFALRGAGGSAAGDASNGSVTWQEGLELPKALQGSGGINILAGVGYLPAVIASTNAVAARQALDSSGKMDAVTALALAAVPPVLSYYQQNVTEAQAGNATQALRALDTLTDSTFGLLPYSPGFWSYVPTRADIQLNAKATYLVSSTQPKGEITSLVSQWQYLGSLSGAPLYVYRVAALKQLIKDAEASRQPPVGPALPYQDWYTLAWVRLFMGAMWKPARCGVSTDVGGICTTNAQVSDDLSLDAQLKGAANSTLIVRILTSLAIEASPDAKRLHGQFSTETADLLIDNLRIQGRTAYFAEGTGGARAASMETQALGLKLLLGLKRAKDTPLLPRVAAYIASPSGSARGAFSAATLPVSYSPWIVALSASTLAQYDESVNSTSPDLLFTATAGTEKLMEATFNNSTVSQPPPQTYTPWSALPADVSALNFTVQGTGEVSVSAGLSFVPAQNFPFPTYRGIWVTSTIQLQNATTGLAVGPSLKQVPLGSVVLITIQVTTPDDLGSVTLEALSPAGLEPLDPLTTSGGGSASQPTCPLQQWAGAAFSGMFWRWWWPICPAQEVRPERVTWKWQQLMAGTSSVTYTAVAATEGTFTLPPVKASADDQPEVMGMTSGGVFTVCGAGCQAAAEDVAAPPNSCPKQCSGNGACNTASGQCVCQAGWSGVACDVQATL